MTSTEVGPTLSKKERKEAKLKRKAAKAALLAAEPAPVAAAELSEAAPKKQKKEKLENGDAAAAENGTANGVKAEKKKKKKKKAAEEQGPEAVEAKKRKPEEDSGEELHEKKKKKKKESTDKLEASEYATPHLAVASQGVQANARVGNADLAKLRKPILKHLYKEDPAVTATPSQEVAAARKKLDTVVDGCDIKPVTAFNQCGFSEDQLKCTSAFTTPSPIQSQCWPIILSGRDLIGIAATGSGKTLAFGLPALRHIAANADAGLVTGKGPQVLILSPTRELALQISAVLEEAGGHAGVKCICVYGGVPKQPQSKALRQGVEIVVATPGRLEDLMQDGSCRLSSVTYLVLDEADRMLDMGFEPHIRTIAGETRADRQTLMFSATWPSEIQKLASEFLASPVRVTIGSQDLSASHSVKQIVEVIEPNDRPARLEVLLKKYHANRTDRVIVFALYKKEAARLEETLTRKGWKAVAVHGDASQAARTRAVEAFKSGEIPLLIATDVAARGLDIPDVAVVINYAFPLTTEDYVHRIGRTGRAGKSGLAHTFFSGATDKARSGELINVLKEAGQVVPPELLKFGTTVKKKESKMYGAHFKDVDFSQKASKITFD